MWKRMRAYLLIIALSFIGASIGVEKLTAQQPYSVPTTTANPFYVANARVDTAFNNRPANISLAASRTLLARETGAWVEISTGGTITLPSVEDGLYYTYHVGVELTSPSTVVISAASTGPSYLMGSYFSINSIQGITAFACNGTTHKTYTMNSGTQGGDHGTVLQFFGVNTSGNTDQGYWIVSGKNESDAGITVTSCGT